MDKFEAIRTLEEVVETLATLKRLDLSEVRRAIGTLEEGEEAPLLPASLLKSTAEIEGDLEQLGYGQRWASIQVEATIEIEVEGHSIEIEKAVDIEIENVTDHVDTATVRVSLAGAIDLVASILKTESLASDLAGTEKMAPADAVAGIAALLLAALDPDSDVF